MIANNASSGEGLGGGVEDPEAEEDGGATEDRGGDKEEDARGRIGNLVVEAEEGGRGGGRWDYGMRWRWGRGGGEKKGGEGRVERERGVGVHES